VLLLFAVTVAVYGRVCWHEFTWWDDQMTLHHNPRYNPPSGPKIAETWTKSVDGLYVPVTYSYWGALAYAAELPEADEVGIHLNPKVYHAGSLVLHLASAIVVFSILRLLSRRTLASVAGAMLFAVHPVQVETIAWASGAKDLLCGLLSLCAIYEYVLHAQAIGRRRWVYYGSGTIVLLLAMLSKPAAMVVPVLVAALDLLILRRSWKSVAWPALGWAAAVAPLALVARAAQVADGVANIGVWQRPLIAADAITFYLWKLVWPVAMAPDYGRRPAVVMQIWGGAWSYVAWLIPAAAAVWMWRGRAARPWLLAGAVVFVAALGPVLGLVPFMFQFMSTVADHYLYLAMLGPALLITWLVVRYPRRELAMACGVALIALGLRANDQLGHWRTDVALWEHTMAVSPHSFVAPVNRAAELGRRGYLLAVRATELRDQGETTRATELLALSRIQYEQALELLDRAIRIKPDYITARLNAFVNNLRLGRNQQAVEHLEAMLAANDALPEPVRSNFNTYRKSAGYLWMKLGRYDRAIAHFERFLAAVPKSEEISQALAEARQKRQQQEAKLDLDAKD
jgi:tetratricopeptide (TPR) repeat protein